MPRSFGMTLGILASLFDLSRIKRMLVHHARDAHQTPNFHNFAIFRLFTATSATSVTYYLTLTVEFIFWKQSIKKDCLVYNQRNAILWSISGDMVIL